jgi:hypothetical protein
MGIEDSPHKRKKYSLTESTPRRTNRKRIPRDTGHQHLAGEELEVSLGDTDSELDDSTRGAEQAKGTVRAESAIKASPQSDPNSLWGPPRSSLNQTSPPTPAPSLARPPRIRFEAAPIFQNLRTSNTRTTPQPSTAQPPRPGSVSQIRPSHSPARDPAVESQVRLEDQPPVSNQALHAEILRKLSPKSQVILQDDETLRGIYFDLSPENQASLAETLEAINLPLGDDRTRSTLRSLALARISNSDLPEAEHSADPEAHAAVDSTSNAVDLAPQAQTTTPAPQPSTPPKNAAGDSPAHPQPSAEESHTPNPTNPEASSSKARPKTQVPLWIITREPRRIEERWSKGKFLGSTLSVFIEDISKVTQRNNIKEIILTLRTPFYDTKMTIFSDDDEDSWTSSKETFIEKLKEARAEAKARRMNESMNFKILVEPVYEQAVLPGGSVEEDDAEFEF